MSRSRRALAGRRAGWCGASIWSQMIRCDGPAKKTMEPWSVAPDLGGFEPRQGVISKVLVTSSRGEGSQTVSSCASMDGQSSRPSGVIAHIDGGDGRDGEDGSDGLGLQIEHGDPGRGSCVGEEPPRRGVGVGDSAGTDRRRASSRLVPLVTRIRRSWESEKIDAVGVAGQEPDRVGVGRERGARDAAALGPRRAASARRTWSLPR